jgi:hypothetical protein
LGLDGADGGDKGIGLGEEVTLEAAKVAADWAEATVAEAAAVSEVATVAANQEWAEALVAEAEAVLEAAVAAANQVGATESAVVPVAGEALVAEAAPAWAAVDPVVVTALEGVLVAVMLRVAGASKLQTGSFPPGVSAGDY